jgi:uncharacterized protein
MCDQTAPKNQNVVQKLLIGLIKAYRFLLSPWFGTQCRFYPSCSQYTETAIRQYGALKGTLMGAWRILKCNPFHPGGVDTVPDKPTKLNDRAYEYTKNR